MSDNLKSLSDEELSRLIAGLIEPLASLPNPDTCDYQDMEAFDSRCWLASYELSRISLMHVPVWRPRDMVNDPAMTILLLEKMNEDEDMDLKITGKVERSWDVKFGTSWVIHYDRLGRAVAEAYGLVKGLPKEQRHALPED
jgi:hypothetical protein